MPTVAGAEPLAHVICGCCTCSHDAVTSTDVKGMFMRDLQHRKIPNLQCRVTTTSCTATRTGRRRRAQTGCGSGASLSTVSIKCPIHVLSQMWCCRKGDNRNPNAHACHPRAVLAPCRYHALLRTAHTCPTCLTHSSRAARTTAPACPQPTCPTSKVRGVRGPCPLGTADPSGP
jgi:hypothetical protein